MKLKHQVGLYYVLNLGNEVANSLDIAKRSMGLYYVLNPHMV
jgi:hypothetical protein